MFPSNPSYKGVTISDDYKQRVKSQDWYPRHFIVSVERAIDRRAAMIRKLDKSQLPYQIVNAYIPSDERIRTFYGRHLNLIRGIWGCGSNLGGVVCCMASHFKALHEFVASGEEIGVILEDDVLFRVDYKERLRSLLNKYIDAPTFPTLISYFGLDYSQDDIYNGVNKSWSTIGYLITASWAKEVLSRYDKPHSVLADIIKRDGIPTELDKYGASSELIIMKSGGLCVSVPMVIEDRQSHSSLIGNGSLNWAKYGLHNYPI